MSKNIKNLLKEAREEIKNKKYDNAIKICKQVLNEDDKNYMSLLLMGAAYQEVNKSEAVKYLKLAMENSTDPTLALQGLSNCVPIDELPDICEKLLELPNNEKYTDVHKKLMNVAGSLIKVKQCLEILRKDITMIDVDVDRKKSAMECLANICVSDDTRLTLTTTHESIFNSDYLNSNDWLEIIGMSLEYGIENQQHSTDHIKMIKHYLKILYKLKRYETILKVASNAIDLYDAEIFAYEWICKIYIENYENYSLVLTDFLNYDLHVYIDKFLAINSESIIALTAYGLFLYLEENFAESRDVLLSVYLKQSSFKTCIKLLAKICMKLRSYFLAEYFFCQILDKERNDLDFIDCLIEQRTKLKLDTAIRLCKVLIPNSNEMEQSQYIIVLLKAFIYNGQYENAQKTIDKLLNMGNRTNTYIYYLKAMKIFYEKSENFTSEALNLLKSHAMADSCDYHLLLGEIYYSTECYPDALNAFLRATQYQPYNSECYLWLGRCYAINTDHLRARKCYEKCVRLNSQNQSGVIALSTMYRNGSEWKLNEHLLISTINCVPGVTASKWAQLQLAYHYLVQQNYDDAITTFHAILTIDSSDAKCWEGLGDSYFHRGSYNSAMNVYDKISNLNSTNFYAKLQVANIKAILKLYREAIVCYQSLLTEYPSYYPALKGLAETHLGYTHYLFSQRLVESIKDNLVLAVKYIVEAIKIRSDFSCYWRLLATALNSIANLPKLQAFVYLPGTLCGRTQITTTPTTADVIVRINGEEIFELAGRCYCRAMKVNESIDTTLIWYELALNYYMYINKYLNDKEKQHSEKGINDEKLLEKRKKYINLAYNTIKYAIKLNIKRWQNWNLLGLICLYKEIDNLQLAQHCFIKALECDKKSAIAWSNLAAFYTKQNEFKLANKAFAQAQQADTSYINGWTGQAIIAEQLHYPFEAMDLFRHTTSLGYLSESAIGYTHWVCNVIADNKLMTDKYYRYAIENLYAIPLALDSIEWFCADDTVNKEGLCFMGYLMVRQHLWNPAIRAFEQAASITTRDVEKDSILNNIGYCQLKNSNPKKAIQAFESVTEATLKSTIGLALAYFKAKYYEKSYSAYESAFEWLASSDSEKAIIIIAMSAMVYSFQGDKEAKSLLFQCIGNTDPPVHGLYSACALGILHEDVQLSELVLKELCKYESKSECSQHVVFLTSQFYLRYNDIQKAMNYILRQIHMYPDRPLLRKLLAEFLLKNYPKTEKYLLAASRIAQSTIILQNSDKYYKTSSMDAARSMAIASKAMRFVNENVMKKLAQKAIYLNPTCKEAWACLILCTS